MYSSISNPVQSRTKRELKTLPLEPSRRDKVSITHIVTGLNPGGAETMLYKLLAGATKGRFDSQVISLIDGGEIKEKIEELGVQVYSLGMNQGRPSLQSFARLAKRLRQSPPHIIQTWMYHSNFVGGLIGKFFTSAPIVWNIRCSNPDLAGRGTIWIANACAGLSRVIPTRIICNSISAWNDHIEMGYEKEKMIVIQNGFDLEHFRPAPEARLAVRKELQLSPEAKLVGIFARFDPFKDPENFVRAAAHLHTLMPDVHFVMCGREMTWSHNQLVEWIEQADIQGNCHLLGQCYDVPHWMAAMDVIVSSSQSEGFPNVLGEAMACGVPCVTTDAGDSALIVGNTGKVVPIKEPEMLAQACEALLKLNYEERQLLGLAARRQIQEHFSLSTIVQRYEQLYQKLLTPQNGKH